MSKHLLPEERSAIFNGLNKRDSFKQIGRDLGKDCTTISKEVRNHLVFRKTRCHGQTL